MDKELGDLDHELRVQGLVETASIHEHWSASDRHLAVFNPMQTNNEGNNAVCITVQAFKPRKPLKTEGIIWHTREVCICIPHCFIHLLQA